jgi:hypothetical protein
MGQQLCLWVLAVPSVSSDGQVDPVGLLGYMGLLIVLQSDTSDLQVALWGPWAGGFQGFSGSNLIHASCSGPQIPGVVLSPLRSSPQLPLICALAQKDPVTATEGASLRSLQPQTPHVLDYFLWLSWAASQGSREAERPGLQRNTCLQV